MEKDYYKQSIREEMSWKDYRLETFEEIIKEGRKFGFYVTGTMSRFKTT